MKPIDNKLLEILVCPVAKSPLRYDDENQKLISGIFTIIVNKSNIKVSFVKKEFFRELIIKKIILSLYEIIIVIIIY